VATGKPMFFKVADVTLTVGPDPGTAESVQCQVHSVAITPEAPDLERYVTLCADSGSATAAGKPTWTADMTVAQAWGADDLARLLWDHQGEEADLYVQAHGEGVTPTDAQPAVSVRVLLVPGPYGGEAETWLEQEVSLPCVSTPELLTAAPVARSSGRTRKETATATASASA
jgi:hypothetical protein